VNASNFVKKTFILIVLPRRSTAPSDRRFAILRRTWMTRRATAEYVEELAGAVRVAALPEWYAEFVESFGPGNEGSSEQGKTNET
jgi:hypothetical protein